MSQLNEVLLFSLAKDWDKCTKALNLASGSFDQTSQPNRPGSHQHLTSPVLFQEVAPSTFNLERVFVRNRPWRRGYGDQEWRNGEPSTQHEGQFHDRGGGSAQGYHDTQVSWNSVPRFWMRKCHLCIPFFSTRHSSFFLGMTNVGIKSPVTNPPCSWGTVLQKWQQKWTGKCNTIMRSKIHSNLGFSDPGLAEKLNIPNNVAGSIHLQFRSEILAWYSGLKKLGLKKYARNFGLMGP